MESIAEGSFSSSRLYPFAFSTATAELNLFAQPFGNLALHLGIIPRTRKPSDRLVLAKPGHLPLGILSRGQLNRGTRFLHRKISAQHPKHLAIPDEIKNLCVLCDPRA